MIRDARRYQRDRAAFIARPFTAQLSPKWHVSAGKRELGIYSHSVSRLRQKRLVPLLRPISRDKMQIGTRSARFGRFLDRSKSDRGVSLGDVPVRPLCGRQNKFDFWVTGFREIRARNATWKVYYFSFFLLSKVGEKNPLTSFLIVFLR